MRSIEAEINNKVQVVDKRKGGLLRIVLAEATCGVQKTTKTKEQPDPLTCHTHILNHSNSEEQKKNISLSEPTPGMPTHPQLHKTKKGQAEQLNKTTQSQYYKVPTITLLCRKNDNQDDAMEIP